MDAVEISLDDLLMQWSQDHRLSEIASRAIHDDLLQTVTARPTELSSAWWRQLFAPRQTRPLSYSTAFWSDLVPCPPLAPIGQ